MRLFRILSLLCILSSFGFSQEIITLREECFYPKNVFTMISDGGYSYVISDCGLHVISSEIVNTSEGLQPQNQQWNKRIHYNYQYQFSASTSLCKTNNRLIIKSDDKILLFNTTDINNISLEKIEGGYSQLSKVFAFGDDCIFLIGNNLVYAKIGNPIILSQISGDVISEKLYINYPYIIRGNSIKLSFYKLDNQYNMYVFKNFVDGPYNSFYIEKDFLIYYQKDLPATNRIVVHTLNQSDFPIYKIVPLTIQYTNLNFTSVNQYYYSAYSSSHQMYSMNGEFIAQFNNGFSICLLDSNYYLYSNKIVYQFIKGVNTRIEFDWVNHYSIIKALAYKGDFYCEKSGYLKFYHNLDTLLVLRDSLNFSGTYYLMDSLIYLKDGNRYRIYQLMGGRLHFVDSCEINTTHEKIQYFGEYVLVLHPAIFQLYKKNGNKYEKVLSTLVYNNITKGYKTGNSLFLLDSTLGVIKAEIINNVGLVEKWKYGTTSQGIYRMEIRGRYLYIFARISATNKKLQVYDISNPLVNPVLLSTITFISSDPEFGEMTLTQGALFLSTLANIPLIIRKYNLLESSLLKEYDLELSEKVEDISLTEGYQRLIVVNSNKITWIQDVGLVTSVNNNTTTNNMDFRLEQNYPNPFNPSTKISYSIAKRSRVSIKIYDIMGREIETLIDKEQEKGVYEIDYTPKNLSSGIYFYTLNAENYRETKKLIYLK